MVLKANRPHFSSSSVSIVKQVLKTVPIEKKKEEVRLKPLGELIFPSSFLMVVCEEATTSFFII